MSVDIDGYGGTSRQWIQRNAMSMDTEERHVSGYRKTSCPQRKLAVTGLRPIHCSQHVSFYMGRGYEKNEVK